MKSGTAEAQRLYAQYQGQINRFHAKARQAVQTNGQQGFAMHQQLSDGGGMRYAFNHGQETIHVEVAPRFPAEIPEVPTKVTTKVPQWLAIDIVLDPRVYNTAEYTEFDGYLGEYYRYRDYDVKSWDIKSLVAIAKRSGDGSVFATNMDGNPGQRSSSSPVYNPEYITDLDISKILFSGTRTVPYVPDGLSSGTYGAGFVANIGGEERATFDIYMTSQSVGIVGSVQDFVKDLGPLQYSDPPAATPDIRYRMQVRELYTSKPFYVFASSTFRSLFSYDQYSPDPEIPPTHFETTATGPSVSWLFAVTDGWQDGVGEAMDPTRPGMGNLVGRTEMRLAPVAPPDPVPVATTQVLIGSELQHEAPRPDQSNPSGAPIVPMEYRNMTRVAVVTWTASDDPTKPGVASIKAVV